MTQDELTQAEGIGAISFEMSARVRCVIAENERLRSALYRALDEIRNWNGGDALADEILVAAELRQLVRKR